MKPRLSLRGLHARRHLSTAQARPQIPPPSGLALLTPTRRLLLLQGIDARKYLQGVTTISIPNLRPDTASYTAFLTAQGRVLYDVFIYPLTSSTTSPDPTYLIEVDADRASRLVAHIKRYKLRSKFTIREIDPGQWDVWASWGEHSAGMADIRAPGLGHRLLMPDGKAPELEAPRVEEEVYRLRRYLYGVPEGQSEILEGVALPQESCIDFMGGIDFRKGCYVGQELTIRTHHTGVVRKRVLPVQIYGQDGSPPSKLRYDVDTEVELPETGADIKRIGKRGRSAGRFFRGVGNVGLALCRLEVMTDVRLTEGSEGGYKDGDEFGVAWETGEGERVMKVKAFVPNWHLLGNTTASGKALVSNTPLSMGE